ncbi:hypothetical protein N8805_03285 [Candidatus Pelagibacter ubique]|nr:hypothetical protein [Candidatus Pelagibacter ubique]
MKKILGIMVLGLLLSSNAYASINSFNKWLYDNGHYELVEKIEKEICKSLDKGDPKYNTNLCHLDFYKNNLDIKLYKGSWKVPYEQNPNRDTLIYYNYKNLFSHFNGDSNTYQFNRYEVKPNDKPYEFNFNKRKDKFVEKQMQKKALLSYLYFQNNEILIDEISQKNRFGDFVDNETKLRSNSVGKSMVSYVLGHAICEGYIEGIDSTINNWPAISNTLYEGQKIIDLLNMRAGDQKYVNDRGIVKMSGFDTDIKSISNTMNMVFRNSKKSKSKYNYNQLVTYIIFNYILHKTGDDFQKILNKTFQKAKIKNSIYFNRLKEQTKNGNASNMFFASRYDYLRIAKAIMEDYQNDTCVGKYLKEIHERRIKKNVKDTNFEEPGYGSTSTYGGQFHMDYPGLKNRVIFGMSGYGGQAILIDVENSRIVVVNSIHYNNTKYKYNVKKLLIDPIKKGK